MLLRCAEYESEAAVAADLDAFCTSPCKNRAQVTAAKQWWTSGCNHLKTPCDAVVPVNLTGLCWLSQRFLTNCAPDMASTGHALMDAMVAPLQSYVQQCPPAPARPVTCNVNQLQRRCDPAHIDELIPAEGEPPVNTLMKCNTQCARLLLQEGMFEACIANQASAGLSGFEVFEPLVNACNLLEEDEECVASMDELLTDVGAACGCPAGGK